MEMENMSMEVTNLKEGWHLTAKVPQIDRLQHGDTISFELGALRNRPRIMYQKS
jgi:hypothetical protein